MIKILYDNNLPITTQKKMYTVFILIYPSLLRKVQTII